MSSTLRVAPVCLIVCFALQAIPQQPAPAKAATSAYKGCVTLANGSADVYLLSTENACMQLSGNFSEAKVLKHLVSFEGLVSKATDSKPMTLKVSATFHIGEMCDNSCELVPPGQRGLHKKGKVGDDGGTAGASDDSQPPQH